jgi:hypothetical protein
MAERVRLRVWVIGLAPLVLAGVAVIAFMIASGRKPASPSRTSAVDWTETPFVPATPAASIETAGPTVSSAPRAQVAVASVARAAPAASSVEGPPPEPLPELDELRRPPGSETWSDEEKAAYRQKAFEHIAARERTLEGELAAAQRAGDAKTAREKAQTLSYLQARRAEVQQALAAQARRAREDAAP